VSFVDTVINIWVPFSRLATNSPELVNPAVESTSIVVELGENTPILETVSTISVIDLDFG